MEDNGMNGLEMRKRSCLTPLLLGSDIEFQDISYSVPEGRGKKGMKSILKSINGRFLPGELTAIMGPSGAGKSTLMNILAGFKCSNVTGDIFVQGEKVNATRFRKMSCYLMQKDELCAHLTVLELMHYAADLKVGHCMSAEDVHLLVNDILKSIGLSHAGTTRTALLSGGEKKRLAIALELVNNPPIMFFDEPSTGLDSSTCFQLITLLKTLARGGRTVICVIHQPNSSLFDLFDHLYMLSEGQCIYQGPTSNLTHFIKSAVGIQCPTYHSPADFAIDVATGKYGYVIDRLAEEVKNANHDSLKRIIQKSLSSTPDILYGSWKVSDCKLDLQSFGKGLLNEGNGGYIDDCMSGFKFQDTMSAPFWRQVNIIAKKTIKCTLRDRTLTNVRLLAHIGLGLLTGLIYFGIGNDASKTYSNVGSLIFGQIMLMCTAMMTTIITYPLEMPVLMREHLNHWYSLKAYYTAKSLADIPFQLFYPVIYHVFVYFLSGQPFEASRFFMCLLMGIMTSLVAQSIGVTIGAVLNLQGSAFLGPVSTAPQFLFSGFFVSFSTIPTYLRWLCYVMYVRYGFEGSMLSIYGFDREDLDCPQEYCHFRSPKKFLQFFEMQDSLYWVDFVALVVYFFVVRFLTYFVLRWRLKTQV